MSDIVERLRLCPIDGIGGELRHAAADEIERLRADFVTLSYTATAKATLNSEAAAFLDALADGFEGRGLDGTAADCRAMAEKLRALEEKE